MKKVCPLISIVVPTYNEEKNIYKCLNSIFSQNYPKEKLEVIVVDDKSTDKTIEIVGNFPVKILISGARHGEVSKMVGFKHATGEFFIYLDADIELRGVDWLKKMIKPLLENTETVGSFTRYFTQNSDPAIERYLTLDPLQRDSIYQFFSPGINETIVGIRDGYSLCSYYLNKIPPAGLCLYRRKELLKLVASYKMFLELDFLWLLVKNGFNTFAYVPEAGLYHHHAASLLNLLKKRSRNVTQVYLKDNDARHYRWFNLKTFRGFLKVALWVMWANLFIPSIFVGIYKSIYYKTWVGLYEPIVNLFVTDIIIYSFLSDKRGRKLI
ncbi:glycosyltransferase [Candidatus Parcubacteria bacterium]|nr:MAG: glycosyltransferase [Candidatus Parcubacteria bacterium]